MAPGDVVAKKWDLFEGLHNFLKDPRFTDFEVKCGEYTFKTQQTGGTYVTQSDLSDHDPAVVARAINFIYTGHYPERDLLSTGVDQFRNVRDQFVAIGSTPLLHASMYALASKLMIPELIIAAKDAFKRTYAHSTFFRQDDWVDLVVFIYTSTKDSDNHLRELVLHGIKHALVFEHGLVYDSHLLKVFSALPELALEISTTSMSPKDGLYCTACDKYQERVFGRCSHGFAAADQCMESLASEMECLYCNRTGLS